MGYGPGSLSLPYALNVMGTNFCDAGTMVYGMPYVGFDPKSGWRNCLVELIDAMYVADIGLTGALAMFSFQGLLVGKT